MGRETSKQSRGGNARAAVLSAQERSEIARAAANKRWAQKAEAESGPLHSMFRGTLSIGAIDLECHVLNDGRRVFTQREIVRVLSGGRESGNLQRYLDRNPLLNRDLDSGPIIEFRVPGSSVTANGYEATMLVEICD